MRAKTMAAAAIAMLAATTTLAFGDSYATRDEAVAMVKKAVAAIKSDGVEKAYAEINKLGGPFTDRDLYVVVLGLDSVPLAHGANQKLIGRDMSTVQDVDGKLFVKALSDNARKHASFWEDYKFANPSTKKIQPKEMYCERLNETAVCAGVYKP